MTGLGDFAGWAALVVSLVGVVPKLLAILTRRRQVSVQAEVRSIQLVLAERAAMLDDCRQQCERCKAELQQERTERVRERDYFYRQITAANARVNECEEELRDLEGIMQRQGWRDQRQRSAPFAKERRRRRADGNESS